MKRYKVLKDFIACLNENDVAIFSGADLSKEAFEHDREGNFYFIDAPGLAASFALGVAMCTNKRVFVFAGDGDFLREIGSYAQMAASKCENIFCVILDNDCYQSLGGHPTIFRSINSMTGVLFNLGFTFFNYTHHFKGRTSIPFMTDKIGRLNGPVSILIKIDKGIKNGLKEIDINKEDLVKRLSNFIKNEEKGTSLYVPPFPLDFFDVETIDGGK